MGRRRANATYEAPHENAAEEQVTYAIDLTDFVNNKSLNILEFTREKLQAFTHSVTEVLASQL